MPKILERYLDKEMHLLSQLRRKYGSGSGYQSPKVSAALEQLFDACGDHKGREGREREARGDERRD